MRGLIFLPEVGKGLGPASPLQLTPQNEAFLVGSEQEEEGPEEEKGRPDPCQEAG